MVRADWWNVDPELRFDSPQLVAMLQLWEDKRGGRLMPARSDFGPRDLLPHLGWIVLLDVELSPLRFRYRLIGTNFTHRIGQDATGRYLDELYPPAIYKVATASFRHVVAERRPARGHGRMLHVRKGHIASESLDMPLSNDGEQVDMIMSRGVM